MIQKNNNQMTASEIKAELMAGRTCPICGWDLSSDRMYRMKGMSKEIGANNHVGYHILAGQTGDSDA